MNAKKNYINHLGVGKILYSFRKKYYSKQ